mmetsp:Transcript_32369/g.81773  ORF Transcript_32369/g.81773 Transcript_32369/m.81773 type:complete len:844 (+) Transcript_32369:67-2598(+)
MPGSSNGMPIGAPIGAPIGSSNPIGSAAGRNPIGAPFGRKTQWGVTSSGGREVTTPPVPPPARSRVSGDGHDGGSAPPGGSRRSQWDERGGGGASESTGGSRRSQWDERSGGGGCGSGTTEGTSRRSQWDERGSVPAPADKARGVGGGAVVGGTRDPVLDKARGSIAARLDSREGTVPVGAAAVAANRGVHVPACLSPTAPPSQKTRPVILVSNLSPQISSSDLRQLFEASHVDVDSVQIPVDKDSGRTKGHALVALQVDNPEDMDVAADFAVHRLQGARIGGMAISIEVKISPGLGKGGVRPGVVGPAVVPAGKGVPPPNAAMPAVPGAAGRGVTVPPKGKKTQICTYWKDGRCTRGQLCSFAHGDHELEPTARAAYLAAQPQPPKIIRAPTLSSDPKFVTNRKTQICVYWKDGRCTRGVSCSFAHGEEELLNSRAPPPRPVPEPVRPQPESRRTQRDRTERRHSKSRSPRRPKPVTFSKRDTLAAVDRTECAVLEPEPDDTSDKKAKEAGAGSDSPVVCEDDEPAKAAPLSPSRDPMVPPPAPFLLNEEGLTQLADLYGVGLKLLQDIGWRPGMGVGKDPGGKLEPVSLQALSLASTRYGMRDRRCLGRKAPRKYKDSDAPTSDGAGGSSSSSRSGSRSSRKSSKSSRSSVRSKSRSRSKRKPRKPPAPPVRSAGHREKVPVKSRSRSASKSKSSPRSISSSSSCSSSSSSRSGRRRRARRLRRSRPRAADKGGFSSTAGAAGAGAAGAAGAGAGAAGAAAGAAVLAPSSQVKEPPEIAQAKKQVLAKLTMMKNIEPKEQRAKEFRLLLREWHPDKNPERIDMATAVFQFLQKGKSLLNLK